MLHSAIWSLLLLNDSFIKTKFTCPIVHPPKVYSWWVSVCLELHKRHHYQMQGCFITPRRNPTPTGKTHHFPPTPQPSATPSRWSLPLWICLCWKFQIQGIIQHVVLCNKLLLLSITSSRFIDVVACISAFYCWEIFHVCICCILFVRWPVDRRLSGFFFLAFVNTAAVNTCAQRLCGHLAVATCRPSCGSRLHSSGASGFKRGDHRKWCS